MRWREWRWPVVQVVVWNIARREEAWRSLLDSDADVALLQEAAAPPADVAAKLDVNPGPWLTGGAESNRPWRTAVVRVSDRVRVEWLETRPLGEAGSGFLTVSLSGTLAAAIVTPATGGAFTVASIYAPWERPHSSTQSRWIYADSSAHRVISDLSALIGRPTGHRILVAGDLNILYGYGENGSAYWAARYASVFSRMSALGLAFVGPQAPDGRRADPWPDELPRTSKNVPTFHTSHQAPASATRQLDFVFASHGLAESVSVAALNAPEHWGPSDHCRIEIEIAQTA